jgi:hypothetical protein
MFVKPVGAKRKDGTYRVKAVKSAITPDGKPDYSNRDDSLRLCGGMLVVELELGIEGSVNDAWSTLEVNYRCARCDSLVTDMGFPQNRHDLREFLQRTVNEAPDIRPGVSQITYPKF